MHASLMVVTGLTSRDEVTVCADGEPADNAAMASARKVLIFFMLLFVIGCVGVVLFVLLYEFTGSDTFFFLETF